MPLVTVPIWFLSTAAFSCSSTPCHPRPCPALMSAGTAWGQKVDLGKVCLGDGQGQLVKVLVRHSLQIKAWQKANDFPAGSVQAQERCWLSA